MTEFEDGFREALRRIDTLPAPVAPISPEAITVRGVAAKRRRVRIRALLVAATVALVATVIGLAGLFAGRGQAGPVVGAPGDPEPSRQQVLVVEPPSPEPMPGTEVVVDDPDTRAGDSQRAVYVDGDTVYLADPVADEIRVYRGGRKVDTIRTPKTIQIVDLVVRDDVFYAIARQTDVLGEGRALGALVRIGDGLGATDLIPSGLVNAEPVGLVRLGQDLVVVDVFGDFSLIAGSGPVPEAPTVTAYDRGDRVLLQDGAVHAELHTRPGQTSVVLLARDATHSWYEVATTGEDGVVEDVVYQFTLAGELVATWSGGRTTTDVGVHDYAVDGGRVYQLVDTEAGVQVVRLQPRPR